MERAVEPARLERAPDEAMDGSKRGRLSSAGRAGVLPTDVWELVAQRLGLRDRLQLALACRNLHRTVQPLLDFHQVAPMRGVRCTLRLPACDGHTVFGEPRISGDGRAVVISPYRHTENCETTIVWIAVPSGQQQTVSLPGLVDFHIVAHVSHNGTFAVLQRETSVVLVHRPPAQKHVLVPEAPLDTYPPAALTKANSSRSERFVAMRFHELFKDWIETYGPELLILDSGVVLIVDSEGTVIRELEFPVHGVEDTFFRTSFAEWGAEDRLVVVDDLLTHLWIYEAPDFSPARRRVVDLAAQLPCPLPPWNELYEGYFSFREGRVFVRFPQHRFASEPLDYVHETLLWSRCLCEQGHFRTLDLVEFELLRAGCRKDTLAPWFLEKDTDDNTRVLNRPPHTRGRFKSHLYSVGAASFNGPWSVIAMGRVGQHGRPEARVVRVRHITSWLSN